MSKKKLRLFCIIGLVLLVCIVWFSNKKFQTQKLFDAVERHDLFAAQEAINRGAWIDRTEYPSLGIIEEVVVINLTPLETACKSGDEEMVELLLKNGANVNTKNKHSYSRPLLNALHGTKSNRFSLAMYLIEQGADIHDSKQAVFLGEDLIYISQADDTKTIQDGFALFKYLMEHEATIAFQFASQHMLTFAAKCGNNEVISYLIKGNYYDIDTYDPLQNTALIAATKNNQVETVVLLLELGADTLLTDKNGKTAMDYAVDQQNARILTLLAESDVC